MSARARYQPWFAPTFAERCHQWAEEERKRLDTAVAQAEARGEWRVTHTGRTIEVPLDPLPPYVIPLENECPHGIAGCVCRAPGADPRIHSKPPKPCATCGGKTGFHALACPVGLREGPRIIGVDLDLPRKP